MRASIIIATYNRPEYICRTIEMALAQEQSDFEVIVIDQTKSYAPEVWTKLEALTHRIVYLTLATPNASAARNKGISHARGEVILFVDDDVEFGPDLLGGHVKAHYAEPTAGVIVGLIVHESWANKSGAVRTCQEQLLPIGKANVHGRVPVRWAPSGNTSFKRGALVDALGFDELLFSSCEDADLTVRVKAAGHQVLFDQTLSILHLEAPSGGCDHRNQKLSWQKECERLWSGLYFIYKNKGIFGNRRVASNIWRSLRGFALNNQIMRQGLREVAKRMVRFTQIFRVVIHAERLHSTGQSISRDRLTQYFR